MEAAAAAAERGGWTYHFVGVAQQGGHDGQDVRRDERVQGAALGVVGGVTGERQVRDLVGHIAPDVLNCGQTANNQQRPTMGQAGGGGRGAAKKLRARSLALIRCTRSLIHTLTHRGSALWPSRDEGASTTTINTRAQRKYLCVALAGGQAGERARAILHRVRQLGDVTAGSGEG